MARSRALFGDRPPTFMSKATLAAELDLSESTVDSYVQRGLLPKPVRFGGSVRWNWPEVSASICAKTDGGEDPFIAGLDNV